MIPALYLALAGITFLAGFVIGLARRDDKAGDLLLQTTDEFEEMRLDRLALEEELVIARREREESWDYANRLLESPQYYADQVGTIRAVAAAPLYGAFGRLPETEA